MIAQDSGNIYSQIMISGVNACGENIQVEHCEERANPDRFLLSVDTVLEIFSAAAHTRKTLRSTFFSNFKSVGCSRNMFNLFPDI